MSRNKHILWAFVAEEFDTAADNAFIKRPCSFCVGMYLAPITIIVVTTIVANQELIEAI